MRNANTDPAPLTMIETFIQFKPRDQWREGMTPEKLRDELNSIVQLPGLTNAWVMPIKTRIDMLAVAVGVGFTALAGVAIEIGVLMLTYLNQSLHQMKNDVVAEGRPFTADDLKA